MPDIAVGRLYGTAILLSIVLAPGVPMLGAPTESAPHSEIDSLSWLRRSSGPMTVEYLPADRNFLPTLQSYLEKGRSTVQTFFGGEFPKPFTVRVFPSRAVMTAYWRTEWGIPDLETECWMVASGTAKTLSLLSPRVWDTEACEHDPDDTLRTQLVITHELVHVFHGQRNPRPEFEGLESIGWFLEGLAVYSSGQLKAHYLATAQEALDSGSIPGVLEDAWSGKYRYGVSGSLVAYIDAAFGREAVLRLMPLTEERAILSVLGVSEDEFLQAWRNWLANSPNTQ